MLSELSQLCSQQRDVGSHLKELVANEEESEEEDTNEDIEQERGRGGRSKRSWRGSGR
jgi:hypothetical protein